MKGNSGGGAEASAARPGLGLRGRAERELIQAEIDLGVDDDLGVAELARDAAPRSG